MPDKEALLAVLDTLQEGSSKVFNNLDQAELDHLSLVKKEINQSILRSGLKECFVDEVVAEELLRDGGHQNFIDNFSGTLAFQSGVSIEQIIGLLKKLVLKNLELKFFSLDFSRLDLKANEIQSILDDDSLENLKGKFNIKKIKIGKREDLIQFQEFVRRHPSIIKISSEFDAQLSSEFLSFVFQENEKSEKGLDLSDLYLTQAQAEQYLPLLKEEQKVSVKNPSDDFLRDNNRFINNCWYARNEGRSIKYSSISEFYEDGKVKSCGSVMAYKLVKRKNLINRTYFGDKTNQVQLSQENGQPTSFSKYQYYETRSGRSVLLKEYSNVPGNPMFVTNGIIANCIKYLFYSRDRDEALKVFRYLGTAEKPIIFCTRGVKSCSEFYFDNNVCLGDCEFAEPIPNAIEFEEITNIMNEVRPKCTMRCNYDNEKKLTNLFISTPRGDLKFEKCNDGSRLVLNRGSKDILMKAGLNKQAFTEIDPKSRFTIETAKSLKSLFINPPVAVILSGATPFSSKTNTATRQ